MASRSTRTIHATTAPRAGNAKLGDLGLATTIRDRDEQITRQLSLVDEDDNQTEDADDTATSMTRGVGTFLYRAPEVAQHRAYDSGADMYSLGVVAFARAFARRIVTSHAATGKRLDFAFKQCLGRLPDRREREQFKHFVATGGNTAWLSIATVLLNLDETLTRE